jgi:hypothetical protein
VTRREVRVSESFFEQLDDQLGLERSDLGAPSSADFLFVEMPSIVERFAVEFDQLPFVIKGNASTRMLIVAGVLLPVVAVYGVLLNDNAIELIGISIDDWI